MELRFIEDRTYDDVALLKELTAKGWKNLTPEERESWYSAREKGAYNFTDLNRIEGIVAELDRWFEIGLETKTDWTAIDMPTKADMERYLGNVASIRSFCTNLFSGAGYLFPVLPETMGKLTWYYANAIEQVLHLANTLCTLFFRRISVGEVTHLITIDREGMIDTAFADPIEAEAESPELWLEGKPTEIESVPVSGEMPLIIEGITEFTATEGVPFKDELSVSINVEADLYVDGILLPETTHELPLDVTGDGAIGTAVPAEGTCLVDADINACMEAPDGISVEAAGVGQVFGEGEILSAESCPLDVEVDLPEMFGEVELLCRNNVAMDGFGEIEIIAEAELSVLNSVDMSADADIYIDSEAALSDKSELTEWIYPVQTENYLYIKQVTTVVKEENNG